MVKLSTNQLITAAIIGAFVAVFTIIKTDSYITQRFRENLIGEQKQSRKGLSRNKEKEAINYFALPVENLEQRKYGEVIKYLKNVRNIYKINYPQHPNLRDLDNIIDGLESLTYAQAAVDKGDFREAIDYIINAKGFFEKVKKSDIKAASILMSRVQEVELLLRKGLEERRGLSQK